MRIEIESDVFDIVDRIKEIDDGYKIMLNLKSEKLELHNTKQPITFCFVIKDNVLDVRVLRQIHCTNTQDIDKIIDDIDNNNTLIEKNNEEMLKDYSNYMSREIYGFSNNSSKEYDYKKAFGTKWRW